MAKLYTLGVTKKRRANVTYRREELERMSLLQLRDVCQSENLVFPNLEQVGSPELVEYILRLRGNREALLVNECSAEGVEALQNELHTLHWNEQHHGIRVPSKITFFEGLDTNYFDGYTVTWQEDIEGVNAVVIDHSWNICALLRVVSVPGKKDLYLSRVGDFPCRTAPVQDYSIIIFPQKLSDEVTRLVHGEVDSLPDEAFLYRVPLLKYQVLQPVETTMPLAVDFGTTNTAAGIYLSKSLYSKIEDGVQPGLLRADNINYVHHISPEGNESPILPTVIGVDRIEGGQAKYSIGYTAEQMALRSFADETFSVFYDIKRWVDDYNAEEQVTDTVGHLLLIPRKEIIKAYVSHIIQSAEQRFKCRFSRVFLSYPVKQKERFVTLYREILPEYDILEEEMFDEGISVLYDIIGSLMDGGRFTDGAKYRALILDCGGGTTDQSSATFSITKGRVAYDIQIETAYENGDTDFGGNNLTFRIMQLLKVAAAHKLTGVGIALQDVMRGFDLDIYRAVDSEGCEAIYKQLEEAYEQAESVIPTKYQEYEYAGREEYYMARNNFYFLFLLAERVKKAFFADSQILRMVVSTEPLQTESDTLWLRTASWKLAADTGAGLKLVKDFPTVVLNTNQVKAVFQADIYDIIRRFFGRLYQEGTLSQYKIVKLTGQSCKIGLFRDAIKEYVPGVLIKQGRDKVGSDYQLKLSCLDGAIRYLSDKYLGYAKVNFVVQKPALPYVLSARSHDGNRITLIHPLDRDKVYGSVSRNMASTEVQLTLEDTRGKQRYGYEVECAPDSFEPVTYSEIKSLYEQHIPQAEVDIIENGEVRYFVWADTSAWGFVIVPVLRRDEGLYLGSKQAYAFENEQWVQNYFDGRH